MGECWINTALAASFARSHNQTVVGAESSLVATIVPSALKASMEMPVLVIWSAGVVDAMGGAIGWGTVL